MADDFDEFEIIRKYFAPLSEAEPGAFGLTDDAAVLETAEGRDLVVTSDCLIAGVHFFADDPARLIAAKALGVNLSDLAAMGATPRAYTLSAAFPRGTRESWVAEFVAGLANAADQVPFRLIGGDTVATDGPLTIGVTAFGEVTRGGALRRNGAQPGDDIYVTGTIGDGVMGLRVQTGEIEVEDAGFREFLISRYRLPTPRVQVGMRLAGVASAVIDVSDGIAADLGHVVRESGVSADLRGGLVPLSPATRSIVSGDPDNLVAVLTGGDDYEILFTAPPRFAGKTEEIAKETGVPITKIGKIVEAAGAPEVHAFGGDGAEIPLIRTGFRHFP